MKRKIVTDKAPLPGKAPFSQALITENLVFTSGQIALTPDMKLVKGSIEEQVKQIIENLQAVLNEAEVSFANVLKTTIYVTDMSVYEKVNKIYAEYFNEPFPAREVVCVKELPLGAQIEISMIATR